MNDQAAWPPRWTVESVRGRGSTPDKGLAAVDAMALRNKDGAQLRVQRLIPGDEGGIEIVDFIAFAEPMRFDRCPICLSTGPFSDEHVPPKSIGGSVMTSTCEECNNRFGSVLERSLTDWWEDAMCFVSFGHQDVPGRRKASRILARQTDSGAFVLYLDGRIDPAIAEHMLPDTTVEMSYAPPDPHRYRLAALKSAYVASCMLTRSIPQTSEAAAIRAELMRVRSLPARVSPGHSPLCSALTVAKSQGPASPGEIALVRIRHADGASEVAISLARTLLVTWPIGGYLVTDRADGTPPTTERVGPAPVGAA